MDTTYITLPCVALHGMAWHYIQIARQPGRRIPSRHHGFQYVKSWSNEDWMIIPGTFMANMSVSANGVSRYPIEKVRP